MNALITRKQYIQHLLRKGYRDLGHGLFALGDRRFRMTPCINETATGLQKSYCLKLDASCVPPAPQYYARNPIVTNPAHRAIVCSHMKSIGKKWDSLRRNGYYPGSYNIETDSTAIRRGVKGPVVGYLHSDLTVTWKEGL